MNPTESPDRRRPPGNPYRSFAIFEQGFNNLPVQFRVVSQLAVLPAGEPAEGANPKPSVARALQASDIACGEMLPRRRLPRDGPDAIEPKQPEFGAQPEIPVGRLCNRPNKATRKHFADFPRGVCVLTHVETGVQREDINPPYEEHAGGHHGASSPIRFLHL